MRAAQCAVVLVQEDGGGALGAGVGQGRQRGRRDRIGMTGGCPIAPRELLAAGGHQRFFDHRHGGQPAVTVQFDGVVGAAADNDFLAAIAAETADHQPIRRETSPAAGRCGRGIATAPPRSRPALRYASVAIAPRPGGVSWIT